MYMKIITFQFKEFKIVKLVIWQKKTQTKHHSITISCKVLDIKQLTRDGCHFIHHGSITFRGQTSRICAFHYIISPATV